MLDAVFRNHELGELTHVEHPAAPAVFSPETLSKFDCVVCYDMPGIDFAGAGSNLPGPAYMAPPKEFAANLQQALSAGTGFVFLHHAIAGWPAWEPYAELMGGRFCYTPQQLRGAAVQDSGYRHEVTHTVNVVADHPVTQGVDPQFEMTDELYLYEVFEDSVTPLLRSSHSFTQENFYSAAKVVVEGERYSNTGWSHAPGSDLVGWTRTQGNSRIVYLQGGDDPTAYGNRNYQQLLGNAIRWSRRSVAGTRSLIEQ